MERCWKIQYNAKHNWHRPVAFQQKWMERLVSNLDLGLESETAHEVLQIGINIHLQTSTKTKILKIE